MPRRRAAAYPFRLDRARQRRVRRDGQHQPTRGRRGAHCRQAREGAAYPGSAGCARPAVGQRAHPREARLEADPLARGWAASHLSLDCGAGATAPETGVAGCMRITFVSALFPPEPELRSVMAAELARAWTRAGHEV